MFYPIPLAVMYSATRVERFDESRRCLNGHRVSPLAKSCEECGAPLPHRYPKFGGNSYKQAFSIFTSPTTRSTSAINGFFG